MDTVDDAPITAEIAGVVGCVFSYLFIFLQWAGLNRQKGVVCDLIFIKIEGPNKMTLRVKNRKKMNLIPYYN